MIKGLFGPDRQEVEERSVVYFVQRTATVESDSRFFLLVGRGTVLVYWSPVRQ